MAKRAEDMSLEAFGAWVQGQSRRFELVDGLPVAQAGGTVAHASIASDILAGLHGHLQPPCRVFGSDMLVVCGRNGRFADVVVSCDARDLVDASAAAIRYPRLIIEVVSASTAAVDRGAKLDEYRAIATLDEYVLIDSRRRWAEGYLRTGDGWSTTLPARRGSFSIVSIDYALHLETLYARAAIPADHGEGGAV